MNYRHIYHAGNLGDVLKHTVLAAIITYMKKKDAAFRILDTHAGIGIYDLTSDEAQRTGEWQNGIGRIIDEDIPSDVAEVLDPWLGVVRAMNPQGTGIDMYPGSPIIARDLMRNQDRLTLTELHPDDFRTLTDNFGGDKHVKLIELDAWLALGSFLPPKERRGLVLIDPAYEVEDEFERLLEGVQRGWKRWQTGTFALWYPIKERKTVNRLIANMEAYGIRNVLGLELGSGRIGPEKPMVSSGMLVVNPPWTLKQKMETALPWLCDKLKRGPGAAWSVQQVIDE
ncbi:23S rRNA (adenine(2030)-N(6))-methyltransferase RlmJ [Pseudovibrio exalbescens]|uniref:23S rRNA (adenine(2030)-N(6))-methyltransferase RlmJ n=1 Tax=Pseudovibrio exalbescens TaxID=197461 RepID=UPI002365AF1A|nr:23S rRNA (adenine(2030)-N(6))-methyltransferase RlmJ [Pseudovibrio exalbescens]MDD7910224.1 23S rRNA (adenine(2030)-N(6))-methyltransferase RlmJ [Pseudovibrio exalbescens]